MRQRLSYAHNDKRPVWRSKDEAFTPKNTVKAVKHGGGGIMLLACYPEWIE